MSPGDGVLTGGCLCGAVRYRASHAYDVAHCHCSRCRRGVGAAFVTWFSVRNENVELAGEPTRYRASGNTTRGFCGTCGTSLTYQHDDSPDEVIVSVGSLDDPDSVQPLWHEWSSRKLGWISIEDGLPCFRENVPRE